VSSVNYPTSGYLDPDEDAQFYVERPEDRESLDYINRGKYIALIGARKTGKTSLLYHLRHQLGHDFITLFVDVMPFKDTVRNWYRQFAEKILGQLQESIEVSTDERAKLLDLASDHLGLCMFLEGLAGKTESTDRILVMMDEVGTVRPEIADPLFRALRAAYNSRDYSGFYRYIFVFAGVFEPADLIKGDDGSIFDVAKKVYMSDAGSSGVRQLVVLLDPEVSDQIVDHIYDWTGGHLYLTQRLCSILDDRGITNITENSVYQAVTDIIADDDSIVRIRQRLNRDEGAKSALKRVLAGKRLRWNNTVVRKLNLIGVVKKDRKNNCVIRNRIFEKALDEYFQEPPLGGGRQEPSSRRIRTSIFALIAILSLLLALLLSWRACDVVQAKLFGKCNETPLTGLRDSNGKRIDATIYSPILLDSGHSEYVHIVIHSHNPEQPTIELLPHRGSGIVFDKDKTNPYKFTIEWRDTSPGILPVRWVEWRCIDVVATMPTTGSLQTQVTTPVCVKTDYLSSLLAPPISGLVSIVTALVGFWEDIRKLGRMLKGQYSEREAGSQR
jgi:hypothetical protein